MDHRIIKKLTGSVSNDDRGGIRFVNCFDMAEVRRFYIIKNSTTDVIRGWRGHQVEKRWFFALTGTFSLKVVKIDDWESPSRNIPIREFILEAENQEILVIPPGHATAIQAIDPESELLVFADNLVEHAKFDDFSWPWAYFVSLD